MPLWVLLNSRLRIVVEKEVEKIDIQAIEEIIFKREVNDTEMYLGDKIDELIKAVQQLDKDVNGDGEN